MQDLTQILTMSLTTIPFIVIHIVGAVLSRTRWQSYPGPSRMAFTGFILFLAGQCLNLARNVLLLQRSKLGWDMSTLDLYMRSLTLIQVLVSIVAWSLLLVAFFWRFGPSTPYSGGAYASPDDFGSEMEIR